MEDITQGGEDAAVEFYSVRIAYARMRTRTCFYCDVGCPKTRLPFRLCVQWHMKNNERQGSGKSRIVVRYGVNPYLLVPPNPPASLLVLMGHVITNIGWHLVAKSNYFN